VKGWRKRVIQEEEASWGKGEEQWEMNNTEQSKVLSIDNSLDLLHQGMQALNYLHVNGCWTQWRNLLTPHQNKTVMYCSQCSRTAAVWAGLQKAHGLIMWHSAVKQVTTTALAASAASTYKDGSSCFVRDDDSSLLRCYTMSIVSYRRFGGS
jgi:hypothetical protein